MSVAPRTGARI